LLRIIRGYDAGEWEDDASYQTFQERWYKRNGKPDYEAFRSAWLESPDFRDWNVNFRGFVKPDGDPILQMEDCLDHTNDN
jgi:hypothetical protein